jgi:DNA-binding beta-propeller fold protein YncE
VSLGPPVRVSERRRKLRERRTRRRRGAAAVLALAVAVAVAVAVEGHQVTSGGGSPPASARSPGATSSATVAAVHAAAPRRATVVRLVASPAGTLPSPVQDESAAPSGPSVALLLGGLTASDLSSAEITRFAAGAGRGVGSLPKALHDTAAVTLDGRTFLFGGGDGVAQHAEILRVDAGRTTVVGRLPVPSSDQTAAVVGGTAYVVGGYDGVHWLDTIVAWRPGSRAHVVAHLPSALRYAAATSVGGTMVIAGGSRPDGSATDAVLTYSPGGRVAVLGRLSAPTTHAAAAALGGIAYVIGGRGAVAGTPSSAVVSVDLSHRRLRIAGHLPRPLSDLAAVGLSDRILVAGGRGGAGTASSVTALRPVRVAVRAPVPVTRVPALLDAADVYAADTPGGLRGAARLALPRVYVPNSKSDTLDVIDPSTFRIVGHYSVGGLPQHVVPAYDLKTLYVTNDTGNSLTTIDPRTGRPGRVIPVDDPYNMYFTPDGRFAIVVAEALHRLDFRDAHTFRLRHSVTVGCSGIDHIDYSADGRYLLASCEFSGQLVEVDVRRQRVVRMLTLRAGAMPQDVKLSPDGRTFYVADMALNGVWKIDAHRLRVRGFLPTGRGAHGLYPSRDARDLYVSNRGEGTVSVVSFATGKIVATWRIPGGSPDMGGVSADGKVLWLSGRYDGQVYAIDTRTGRLLHRITVGDGPHGLSVWPQPGRYSLGHTGIMR